MQVLSPPVDSPYSPSLPPQHTHTHTSTRMMSQYSCRLAQALERWTLLTMTLQRSYCRHCYSNWGARLTLTSSAKSVYEGGSSLRFETASFSTSSLIPTSPSSLIPNLSIPSLIPNLPPSGLIPNLSTPSLTKTAVMKARGVKAEN